MSTTKRAFTLRTDEETAQKLIQIINSMQLEEGRSLSYSEALTEIVRESFRVSDSGTNAKLAGARAYYELEGGEALSHQDVLLRIINDWRPPARANKKREPSA